MSFRIESFDFGPTGSFSEIDQPVNSNFSNFDFGPKILDYFQTVHNFDFGPI